MGLNIKNNRVHGLIRELADATGTSQTGAVEDAVRHRLAELSAAPDDRNARIDALLAAIRSSLSAGDRLALLRAEPTLYNDDGHYTAPTR